MNRTLMMVGVLAIFALALLITACGSDDTPPPSIGTIAPPTPTTPAAGGHRHRDADRCPNRRAYSTADSEAGNTSADRRPDARADSSSHARSDTAANSRGAGGS